MSTVSIPWAKPSLGEREKAYVVKALESTWISGGPFVDRLEEEFSRTIGSPHGLAVANGTVALHLAMLALGIGPGDEVIVPGLTFVAPANMVLAVGARPVFADVCQDTWCLDPASVETSITSASKAVVAVHLYGNMPEMPALRELCDSRGLALVEDVAEAAFSRYQGRHAGTFGELGCFSFQATKTITTGEGGFVATGSPELHRSCLQIRDHGMRKDRRYWHEVVGFNFRLTNLQAALGCAQMEGLSATIEARAAMDRRYRERLSDQSGLILQHYRPEVEPVVWAVPVRLCPRAFPPRDEVIARMLEAGIELRPGFYSFHQMPLYQAPPLPVVDRICGEIVSLPCFPSLTEDEIARICDALLGLRR